jgi:hypothetical protein
MTGSSCMVESVEPYLDRPCLGTEANGTLPQHCDMKHQAEGLIR